MSEQPEYRLEKPAKTQKPIHPLEQRPPSSPSSPPPAAPLRRRVDFPRYTPILSYVILCINVLVFLSDTVAGALTGIRWLTVLGAKDNLAILGGQYWRLVTPMFLHGDIIHLGFNSYFLYLIGPQVERTYGPLRFSVIYLLSGVAGVLASLAFTASRSIGASGALFGLLGALLLLLYRNRKILNTQGRIRGIIMTILFNLLYGLRPGIDNWGHVGGLVGGLALGWFSTPRYVLRDQLGDLVRIEDESSPVMTWSAIMAIGAILGVVAILLVGQRLFVP